ncbi:hypothetical protein CB1_001052016 [Camelus ferus]|nr:hypothetical protein CB1_001052016 [Camelus ferus]
MSRAEGGSRTVQPHQEAAFGELHGETQRGPGRTCTRRAPRLLGLARRAPALHPPLGRQSQQQLGAAPRRRRTGRPACGIPTGEPLPQMWGRSEEEQLNRNSLLDEEVSRALNAETPKSSPLLAKGRDSVETLIPKDITDPLSLNTCTDKAQVVLASPLKTAPLIPSLHGEGTTQQQQHRGQNRDVPQPYELNTDINFRDEVVTSSKSEAGVRGGGQGPKRKGLGSGGGRHQVHPLPAAGFKKQQRKFQYGNYCKYYGYRNPSCEDGRLRVLKPEWFRGRDVLDLGCSVGHLTLSIACKWGLSRMVGLDIDARLIHSARGPPDPEHCL